MKAKPDQVGATYNVICQQPDQVGATYNGICQHGFSLQITTHLKSMGIS